MAKHLIVIRDSVVHEIISFLEKCESGIFEKLEKKISIFSPRSKYSNNRGWPTGRNRGLLEKHRDLRSTTIESSTLTDLG